MGEEEQQHLNDDEIRWIKIRRMKEARCRQRRTKIIDALLIWGSIGLASAIIAGLSGLANFIYKHLKI